ncbi:hypothetical protein, partial [Staphylococcus haemolyticus]
KTVTGTNIITTIISLPTDIGLNLARRAQSIMRSRQQFRHAIRLANRTARDVGGAAASNTAAGFNKNTMGATWNAATTPSEWASHGVNYLTNKTSSPSNTQENEESANDFAARQSGASNTGRTGTARSTLLGDKNPNPSNTNNPYGGHNYFVGARQPMVGSPASITNKGANNKPVDPENHQRNNQYKDTARVLPSA